MNAFPTDPRRISDKVAPFSRHNSMAIRGLCCNEYLSVGSAISSRKPDPGMQCERDRHRLIFGDVVRLADRVSKGCKMNFSAFAGRTQLPSGIVLSPLSAEVISERQTRRMLIVAGAAVYLVIAFTGLDLLG